MSVDVHDSTLDISVLCSRISRKLNIFILLMVNLNKVHKKNTWFWLAGGQKLSQTPGSSSTFYSQSQEHACTNHI